MPGYVKSAVPGVEITAPSRVAYEELRIKTIDTGYAIPGRVVVKDTDDKHVKVCASGDAGVIGFIAPNPTLSVVTDFTTEDVLRIGHGPGAVVMLYYTGAGSPGLACTKGDALYAGVHGSVYKGSTDATKIVAWAEESHTASDGLIMARLAR